MSVPTAEAQNIPYSSPQTNSPVSDPGSAMRLWPGIALVAVMWIGIGVAVIGEFDFLRFFIGRIITPLVVMLGILLWWLFASRLRWSDRLLVAGAFVAVVVASIFAAYPDFPPMAMVLFALPKVLTAWVGLLVIAFFLPWPVRRAGLVLTFVVAGVLCSSLRVDGMSGDFTPKFSWRWTPKPEEEFLAELKNKSDKQSLAITNAGIHEQPGDWPGFRGPQRDSRLTGVQIKTDWQKSPPPKLWRQRIGPGWSSFAVVGDRLFTQEQRGPDEYVVCYDATNGSELWTSHDSTRFEELVAGPGPRATPTFHDGRLYTYGANSHLKCVDAASGKTLWSHDVATEFKSADAEKGDIPIWGFASSPLVTQGVVIVFAGAREGKTVAAYAEESGKLAWTANVGPAPDKPEKVALSYSSPQLVKVQGVEQVLLATDAGLSAFEPAQGKELWHYSWSVPNTARIVQPAVIGDGDLLVGTGMGNGTRRIHLSRKGDEWETEDLWTCRKFKPYFNDFVVYHDYLFGIDSGKLICINLKDGSECWHASGYGSGQVLLLADQGLLLILAEDGNVALVAANSEKREELCRFKAIDGKTWNHPVVAHGRLYVRNGEEMACYKLDVCDPGPAKTVAER